jgi:hypothetical protein
MCSGRCLAVAVLLLGLSAVARAETIAVGVSEDESVVSDVGPNIGDGLGTADTGYPTVNPHYHYTINDDGSVTYHAPDETNLDTGKPYGLKGMLWTGVLKSGISEGDFLRTRFYLKFDLKSVLPTLGPGQHIASATLKGYYYADLYPMDDAVHEIYLVNNDNWSENPDEFPPALTSNPIDGVTWDNQPLLDPADSSKGSLLQSFSFSTLTPESWLSWDITSAVQNEYAGDGVLSLMFKAQDESFSEDNLSYEKFQEKDCSPCCAFVICLTIVPGPSTLVGLLSMGATGGLIWGWRRRRARAA